MVIKKLRIHQEKNREWRYYPSPHSYIVFYHATTDQIDRSLLCTESFDSRICSYTEARELIDSDYNKEILDYVYNK